jgi:3-hydroxyisobutyrate dehydrogenase-like beta-hydroxyacid dehydrogenase
MAKIAFLGLGVMGFPMAGHLFRAGHDMSVYNRTAAKADAWVATYGGNAAQTPAAAAQDCDFVISCVGADADIAEVTTGSNGAFAAMKTGAIFIDHTTVSAKISRALHQQATESGIGFLDAPVSGGQAGAQNGQLTIMVGGQADFFAAAEPVMKVYAKRVGHMGPSGAGQLAKMVNQICIAGLVQALAESVHFAKSAGLEIDLLYDVLAKGAAQSWQMENRARTMAKGEFDFGFAVDWMRKDLGLVLDEAKSMGLTLPVTALVDQFYAQVQRRGGNRQDTSSLMRLMEDKS